MFIEWYEKISLEQSEGEKQPSAALKKGALLGAPKFMRGIWYLFLLLAQSTYKISRLSCHLNVIINNNITVLFPFPLKQYQTGP